MPDLVDVPVLAEKVAVSVLALLPEVAERLIQDESLTDALHDPPLHPLGDEAMLNVAVPPDAGILLLDVVSEDELIEKVHVGVAAACVTVGDVTGPHDPGCPEAICETT